VKIPDISPRNWALLAAIAAVAALPSLLSISNGGYFYGLVIWPICIATGTLAVWLVPPGGAVLIYIWRAKRLDKVQSVHVGPANRRQIRLAALGFTTLIAWEFIRAFWQDDHYAAVSITIGAIIDVALLYALSRYRFRRHHIATTVSLVVDR
jgi:hypothetical protein